MLHTRQHNNMTIHFKIVADKYIFIFLLNSHLYVFCIQDKIFWLHGYRTSKTFQWQITYQLVYNRWNERHFTIVHITWFEGLYILRKFVASVHIFHFNRNSMWYCHFVQDNVRLDLLYQTRYDFVMVPWYVVYLYQICLMYDGIWS